MKYAIIATILIATISSCKKTQEVYYHSHDNVYFDFETAVDRDSLIYTFAYTPDLSQDTVFLPVRISGIRVKQARKFGIMVVSKGTTAVANTHYQPFKSEYTMPADSGTFLLPVILYNTDAALSEKSVTLNLKLTPSVDLDTTNNTIINAKIVFSNKLEKPSWWSFWPLGSYSQIKHQLWLISTGVRELTTVGTDAPQSLYYIGKLNALLTDPFTWVNNNPAKGYILTQRSDGNYDFYSTDNPAKKILLRKNASAGRFFFIDENGAEII
jgi:hypothetical protein